MNHRGAIAYFSMEIALDPAMPTYSGGLGILAGDTIRAAADLGMPMVAVTLLHRKGYLRQSLDSTGWQSESDIDWPVEKFLRQTPFRVSVSIEGRLVDVQAWRYDVPGINNSTVPVFFLDTKLPQNTPEDQGITDHLYGGDDVYRVKQEVVLGIGGVRMLRVLGYESDKLTRYHMNEGHAALLGLELLREEAAGDGRSAICHEDVEAVRRTCVFTTHTPVKAGHDQFPLDLMYRIVGKPKISPEVNWEAIVCSEGRFNMTLMALSLSHYINGVAKRHAEVARLMFARYPIDSITNGVHAATWVSPHLAELLDRHVPEWRADNFSLRCALSIPKSEIHRAHALAKGELLEEVRRQAGLSMNPEGLTIGFARRATAYKRANLLFQNPQRLIDMAARHGPIQLIFGGKAHARDLQGKQMIQDIFKAQALLGDHIKVAYLQDYDMRIARLMVSGVDVWLNTPQPPMEASGTSGMKAALNGVPSLSILDGWWIEGCIDGVTGWAVGTPEGHATFDCKPPARGGDDAEFLYQRLEEDVLPAFYQHPDVFLNIMVHCISLNGSFFNTHRMLQQYVTKAYYG